MKKDFINAEFEETKNYDLNETLQLIQLPEVTKPSLEISDDVYENLQLELQKAHGLVVNEDSVAYCKKTKINLNKKQNELKDKLKEFKEEIFSDIDPKIKEVLSILTETFEVLKEKETKINEILASRRIEFAKRNIKWLLEDSKINTDFLTVDDLFLPEYANKGAFNDLSMILGEGEEWDKENQDQFIFVKKVTEKLNEEIQNAKLCMEELSKIEDEELRFIMNNIFTETKNFNFLIVKSRAEEELNARKEKEQEEILAKEELNKKLNTEPAKCDIIKPTSPTKVIEEPVQEFKVKVSLEIEVTAVSEEIAISMVEDMIRNGVEEKPFDIIVN